MLDDATDVIHAAGGGTLGTDIFQNLASSIPGGDGPYTLLVETGGSPGEKTQHRAGIAYEFPSFQAMVIAANPVSGKARLMLIRNALVAVKNQFINSVWYLKIDAQQSNPIELPLDPATSRSRFAMNFMCYKRPS